MIELNNVHPFVAAAEFAVRWLTLIARRNLAGAESLFDENTSGMELTKTFPESGGVWFCEPESIENWTFHIVGADSDGFSCEFEMPMDDPSFRPVVARFFMRFDDSTLSVEFTGAVPS